MSYNGYNQFSPYYQQPHNVSQQGTGAQYSAASKSSGSYPNSYQPLSAYQTDYQRQQSQPDKDQETNPVSSYGRQAYTTSSVAPSTTALPAYSNQNYGGADPTAGNQDTPSGYAVSRPDTSALGNLAYASSLGQNSQTPSLSQLIDSRRAQPNYGTSPYGPTTSSQASQSTYSQAATGLNNQASQSQQSQPYSPKHQTSFLGQPYSANGIAMSKTGRSSPAQHQYATSQQASSHSRRQDQHTSQLARPPSGQAARRPDSGTSAQSTRSPQFSASHVNQTVTQRNSGYSYGQSQASSAAQPNYRASPSNNSTGFQAPQSPPQTQSYSNTSHLTSKQTSKGTQDQEESARQPLNSWEQQKRTEEVNTQTNGNIAPQPAFSDTQQPTTVDPNQVFNHYEYQRRQSEAETAKVCLDTPKSAQDSGSASSPADDVTQAAKALMGGSAVGSSDSATKEQIELEMKAMIEKMREYKAQDPTLFSQIWEGVKKGQPAPSASTAKSSGSKSSQAASAVASPTQTDLPAESDFPAASSFGPEFDRGRYPMQRRRRGNASYTPEARPTKIKSKSNLKAQATQHESSQATPAPETSSLTESFRRPMDQSSATGQFKSTSSAPIPPLPIQAKAPSASIGPSTNDKKPPATGGTYWPEHKKRALAEAARMALVSSPPNIGKSITAGEIHMLLDRNPSYNDLCLYLEGWGFIINKPEFARILLAAVPDMQSSAAYNVPPQPSRPAPLSTGPNGAYPPPPPAYGYPSVVWQPFPVPHIPTAHMYQPQAPLMAGQNGGPLVSPSIKAESASAAPQSKQEKARKRDFGELVDLTAFSDEEDYRRHHPKPRIEKKTPALPGQTVGKIPPNTLSNDALKDRWRPNLPAQEQPHKPIQQQPYTSPAHKSGREHLLYDMVVDPMNKRRDALRRSSYDARTIARDILVSSGKHPTLAPLNQHLDALRDRFISVDQNSDLSTFQWNLVDPGGKPFAPRPKPESQFKVAAKGGQNQDDVDTTLAKATTAIRHAPQVNIRSGRPKGTSGPDFAARPVANKHPDGISRRGRPPNPNKIKKPKDNESVASNKENTTQKGDLESGLSVPAPYPAVSAQESQPESLIEASPNVALKEYALDPPQPPMPSASEPVHTPIRAPGRKGRPPGAKNKQPRSDKGISKKTSQELRKTPQTQRETPTIHSDYDESTLNTYQTPTTSSLPSHLKRNASTPARSSGLRNAITPTSASVAVVIPTRSRSIAESARKSGGRVQDKDSGTSPSYQVYKCHWEGCPAELHNLDTLRKHVRKQHRERSGKGPPWPCKWTECWDTNSDVRPILEIAKKDGGQRERLEFVDEAAWDKHVDGKHLALFVQRGEDGGSPSALPRHSNAKAQHTATLDDNDVDNEHSSQFVALAKKKKGIGGMGIYATGVETVTDKKREIFAKSGDE